MTEIEPPRLPIKERLQNNATLIFSAAQHKLDQAALKAATVVSTLSRVRVVVEPEKQEVEERRMEKFQALEPYMRHIPLHVTEIVLDYDKLPFVDKYGNKYPSLYDQRKERKKRAEKSRLN